jgi:hypothetical protein
MSEAKANLITTAKLNTLDTNVQGAIAVLHEMIFGRMEARGNIGSVPEELLSEIKRLDLKAKVELLEELCARFLNLLQKK